MIIGKYCATLNPGIVVNKAILLVSTVVILVELRALYAILEDLGWGRAPNPDKP